MKILTFSLLFILLSIRVSSQNHSLTYDEAIAAYQQLDSKFEEARMFTYGRTDCGKMLNLFVISATGNFDQSSIHSSGKCVLMINNGIHPGEPDGIDASVAFATDLLTKPLFKRLLENVVVCIVPVFNIDGALERGCCSRSNQNGPDEYGFRANSRNLDLNRDFAKCESRNTMSLITMIRQWNPDVFVDTHVSDGADYQYTMTLINGQHNKLSKPVGDFMNKTFVPALFDAMKDAGDEMTPYVNTYTYDDIPDSGIYAFLESPRFLGGYQSLFECFTFTVETHMLKPFAQRVESTRRLLTAFLEFCNDKSKQIIECRKQAVSMRPSVYYYNWKADTVKFDKLMFKGYTAEYKDSKVTNGKRLFYNRDKPYKKEIRNYRYSIPTDSVRVPKYFVIPQAWSEIAAKLELNGVRCMQTSEDSTTEITSLVIDNYETVKNAYEGHYLHYNVTYKTTQQKLDIHKGDYLVPLFQNNYRYCLETLMPDAVDSYFCWGFFDSILMQKEWFSDYVFEDIADSLLSHDASLNTEFRKWQSENPKADETDQLGYIYMHSKYFEKNYKRYPIALIY